MHKAATRHDSTRKHYPQPDAIIKQSQSNINKELS